MAEPDVVDQELPGGGGIYETGQEKPRLRPDWIMSTEEMERGMFEPRTVIEWDAASGDDGDAMLKVGGCFQRRVPVESGVCCHGRS